MKYIRVEKLDGIPSGYCQELSEIAQKIKGEELLALVLYFMSGLENMDCSLSNIESNMRLIHQSKKNTEQEDYANYAASNIRGHLDKETQRVRQGRMEEGRRLFIKLDKGYWKNSLLGNQLGKQILENHGYDILFTGSVLPEDQLQELEEVDKTVRSLQGKERVAAMKIRVNQGKFRKMLLSSQKTCKICGLSQTDLLVASHIKSWADSTANEKLDPNNGFMLCPNHDALFDKHYISFEDKGKILISSSLSQEERKLLGIREDMEIQIKQENMEFLRYHRYLTEIMEKARQSRTRNDPELPSL